MLLYDATANRWAPSTATDVFANSEVEAALSATIATEAKGRGASNGEVYVDDYPRTGGETTDEGRIQRAEDAVAAARGGTLVFGPNTYTIAAPIIKRRGVSWRGQGVDINYEVSATDPTQERGSCILQDAAFVGDELVAFDPALTVQSSYPITISGISFRGSLTAPVVGIRVEYAHLAKIIFCRFSSFTRAIHAEAIVEVAFNYFDSVHEQVYLHENCTESLVAFNHGNALYRAIVVVGDGHRVIGNKLYGDVRNANYASPNPRSVAGVYVYGTRNVISSNYIDQWMHAGVIIDSSLTSTAAYGYGASFFGPYGNTISANVISNCGHNTYTASGTGDTDPDAVLGVSAGVVLLVAARGGGDPVQPKIYRNIITGNVIETGYTKGWTLAGTTDLATRVGIHMIGLVAGDIYDNVIEGNTFDSELVTDVLAHNGAVASNKVGTYRGDTEVGASLPPKSAHWYAAVSRDITATVMVNQRLTVAPVFLSSVTKITDLAFEVTTAGEASSTFSPAIYADDGQGAAGALVYGGTATSTSTTGVKTISGLTLTLEPGWYWIGGLTLSAPTTPPALRTNGQSLTQGISGATSAAVVLATPVMGAQQNGQTSLPATMTPALNGSAIARVAYKATA